MAFLNPQLSTGKAPRLGLELCPRAQDCPVSAHCLEMWNERLLIPEPCPKSFSSPPCPKTFPSPPCPSPWLGQGEEKGRAQTRSRRRASLLPKQMFLCAAPGRFARGRRLSVNMQPPEKKEAPPKKKTTSYQAAFTQVDFWLGLCLPNTAPTPPDTKQLVQGAALKREHPRGVSEGSAPLGARHGAAGNRAALSGCSWLPDSRTDSR